MIKLQLRPTTSDNTPLRYMYCFKITYLIGNFKLTYIHVGLFCTDLHVHTKVIPDFQFDDNEKIMDEKISFYILMLQKLLNL